MTSQDIGANRGLSPSEVAASREEHGDNRLPARRRTSVLVQLVKLLMDPLTLVLLVAGGVTIAALGRVAEGTSILAIVVLNTAIATRQQRSADDAVAALDALAAPCANVWRDAALRNISADEVVVGDLVELAAGDRAPADGRLVAASVLSMDESTLTGESLYVDKEVGDELFAATMIMRGSGTLCISAVGPRSALGKIAASLGTATPPPLVAEIRRIALRVSVLAVAVGTIVAAASFLANEGESHRLADALLLGVALSIGAIPEGLATVVLSALTLGARRMARLGVIVRHLPAIEALGSASILCTDKTGTITTGDLVVVDTVIIDGRDRDFWLAVVRANDSSGDVGDPLDVVLMSAGRRALLVQDGPRFDEAVGERVASHPFDAESRLMATVHRVGDVTQLSVKGAPEPVLNRCRDDEDHERVTHGVERFVASGLRAIVVADAVADDLTAASLRVLGVVGLGDPPRPSAAPAVAQCRSAGIRIVMVTGDHAATAKAIATSVGMVADNVLDASGIADLDSAERARRFVEADVVARVRPDVKTELVDAHRGQGRTVAMTGDGVNDAPALRRADVGVALAGIGGTDVARAAANVVVTDGDLSRIVSGVAEGRRIYRNLSNVVRYLLTGNASEIMVVIGALAVLPDLRTPLLPVQLLWVNLITDGLPGIALAADRPVGDPLLDPPRPRTQHMLSVRRLARIGLDAFIMAVVVLSVVWLSQRRWGWGPETTRSALMLTLLASHLLLVLVVRAERRSLEPGWSRAPVVIWAVAGSAVLQGAVYSVAPMRSLLGLRPVPPIAWVLSLVAAMTTMVLLDIAGSLERRLARKTASRRVE